MPLRADNVTFGPKIAQACSYLYDVSKVCPKKQSHLKLPVDFP